MRHAGNHLAQRGQLVRLNHLLKTQFSFLTDSLVFRDILPGADNVTG